MLWGGILVEQMEQNGASEALLERFFYLFHAFGGPLGPSNLRIVRLAEAKRIISQDTKNACAATKRNDEPARRRIGTPLEAPFCLMGPLRNPFLIFFADSRQLLELLGPHTCTFS